MEAREITAREEWNRLVTSLPDHHLHQGWEWGEIRASQGWKARRLAVFDGRDCVAASSVLARRVPLLGSIVYAPAGPLIKNPEDGAVWAALLAAIREAARAEGAVFFRAARTVPRQQDSVPLALCERGFSPLPDDWTTWNVPRIVMRMSAVEPEEALKQGLRRRFREYIASAPRRGLTVRPAASLEEGLRFRAALATIGQRRGQPVRNRRYFERVWNELIRPGSGVLLLAEHEGRVVGGLLGARLGRGAHMLYAVVRDVAGNQRLHQAPLLYWEFVRWAKQGGCDTVDWGGIGTHLPPREDDPGFGLYQFKLGFNAGIEHLTAYHDLVFAPRRYAFFRFLERHVAAPAWTWRARFNQSFDRLDRMRESARLKLRQFGVSIRQRGLGATLYWGAFGFLRPNRFFVYTRKLADAAPRPPGADLRLELWDAAAMRAYRSSRKGLPTELYQDEIDGVELCSVLRAGDEVAGLIWIYRPEDASRLFRLREAEAELNNGVVLPAYRGRGLFKAVIAHACDWLRAQEYQTVYAMVHSTNGPSRAAFEAAGFHSVATVRHFLLYRPTFRGPASQALPT